MLEQKITVQYWLSGTMLMYLKGGGNSKNLSSGRKCLNGVISSKTKRIFLSRCAYLEKNKVNYSLKTITLTYKLGSDQFETKKHLNRFLTWLKKPRLKDNWSGVENYVYTVELTKCGQVHYHFILDCQFMDITKIKEMWCKARGGEYAHASIGGVKTIKNTKHASRYFSKYMTKASSKIEVVNTITGEVKTLRKYATSNKLVNAKINFSLTKYDIDSNNLIDIIKSSVHNAYQPNEFITIFNTKDSKEGVIYSLFKHYSNIKNINTPPPETPVKAISTNQIMHRINTLKNVPFSIN